MLQSSAVGRHLDLGMPSSAQAGGHFQGDTAVLRPSEGRASGHHGPGGAGSPPASTTGTLAPLPRCRRVPFSTRTPLAAGTLGPARWVRTRTSGQTGSAVPTEGSFRLLLASPSRRPPHPPQEGALTALPCWCGADPGSPPFRCFPEGKEGASGSSGSLHPRGPGRCPHSELLRPSPGQAPLTCFCLCKCACSGHLL